MIRSVSLRTLWLCLSAAFLICTQLILVPMGRTQEEAPRATVLPVRGRPLVNLRNPQSLTIAYSGPSKLVAALKAGAVATALASGDFDADGAPDLVAGYNTPEGGVVTLLRGNPDAFAPRDRKLFAAAMHGDVPPTFVDRATAYAVPSSPDFLAVGDFNRDGYKDLLVGTRGGGLYLLAGDGKGNLGSPQAVPLSGAVEALNVSIDGHVAVGLEGAQVVILAPSAVGLRTIANETAPGPVTSLGWGPLGSGFDLAVGSGSSLMLIYAPLSQNPQTETVNLPFGIEALSIGDYIWDRDGRQEIAALGDDGAVHILAHGTLDTRPLTPADIPGRRAAIAHRPTQAPNPMGMGAWTVAKTLANSGTSLRGPASRAVFSSPRLAAAETHDLMLLDAGKNQLRLLDTSGKAVNASAAVAFSGTPVAALALPQKIDASRDVVVLTSSQTAPITVNAGADPTYNVNTTADEDSIGACTNASVTSVPTTLSLREAVCLASNNSPGTFVINLPEGTYQLTSLDGGELLTQTGATGENLSIVGADEATTIIQQTDGTDRILAQDYTLSGSDPVAISDLTMSNGLCNNDNDAAVECGYGGGAILGGGEAGSDLTLTDVTMSNNQANPTGGSGGGGQDNGGAISFEGPTLTITGSTFTSNVASGSGGAINAYQGFTTGSPEEPLAGSISITNSTFTNNTNVIIGGGAYLGLGTGYPGTVSGSTFTGNSTTEAAGIGGALGVEGGSGTTLSLSNSRISGNSASKGTGLESYVDTTATNNWWGCNAGPGTPANNAGGNGSPNAGCDSLYQDTSDGTALTYDPWLVLGISANSTTVDTDQTTGVTADLTHNSSGTGGFSVPNGTPVSFGATLGTISGASSSTTSGQGTATFTAGSTPGAGSGKATVDNQTVSVTINIIGSTTTSASNATATYSSGSQAVSLSATVTSGGGTVNSGTVTFSVFNGGTQIGSSTSPAGVTGGSASASYSLPGGTGAGTYTIVASYVGAGNFASSSDNTHTLTVNAAGTTTTAVNQRVPFSSNSQSVTLSATVTSTAGTVNGGTVTFSVFSGGSQIGSSTSPASVSNGTASASYTLPGGTAIGIYSVQAVYAGAGGFSSSSDDAHFLTVTIINACTTANPNPSPNPAVFVATQDFNGDCKSDILWENSNTNQIYEWLMNGTTAGSSGSPGSQPSAWAIQGTGDFNGDGMSDILWRNTTTNQVEIWLMNGITMTSSGIAGTTTSDWVIEGTGDFNGTGRSDILWRNSTTGQVYIWFMNGTTTTSSVYAGNPTLDWVIEGVGDFDGDGKADILWRNSNTGQVYIWFMDGATVKSSATPGSPAAVWVIQGVGDFNGDGMSDILWRNSTTGQVYVWLMDGATATSSGSPGTPTSDWVIEGTGDYDGSGRSGVLWRNSTTGQVYIWLMTGTTSTSSGTPGTPAAVWQIQP